MGRPVILLDHTPIGLNEAADAGVDLQLSGHTHAGQVFPATLVNSLLYETGNGYGRKGKTQYYVTTGVGVWSPPARIGTTAEIA
jgi:predicted MPP superfamily phosphohydrolase